MSDSNLTPDQDDAVRALLADARHTEPAPADVVARLDDTLASLTAERLESRAPVVTLASRRRRTAATALLVAAAVVVGGFGIGQIVSSGNTAGDSSAGSAADSAPQGEAPSITESDQAESAEPDSQSDTKQGDTTLRSEAAAPLAVMELSSDSALKPVARLLRPVPGTAAYSASECLVDAAGAGDEVSITLDGDPGALVYRAPVAGKQRVDVFLCGTPDAVRSVTLRAP